MIHKGCIVVFKEQPEERFVVVRTWPSNKRKYVAELAIEHQLTVVYVNIPVDTLKLVG